VKITRFVRLVPAAFASAAIGQIIDFELAPDGSVPVDDAPLALDAAYTVDGVDVTFGFDTDGDGVTDTTAFFEIAGNDGVDGFLGPNGTDGPRTGFADQLGTWFLRSPGDFANSGDPGTFIVEYSEPVPGVSGEVWDIDGSGGTEAWLVSVFDDQGTLLRTIRSPEFSGDGQNSLNGEPWVFSIADPAGIVRVELNFDGTKTNAIGLAFNNYLATDSLAGPTLLTHQPDLPVTDPSGIATTKLYWSEPIDIREADVSVLTADALGEPVPFELEGSGTQVITITFTGLPGGNDTNSPVPALLRDYAITVRDSALALDNNAPIDGDNDGVSGGDATVVVSHTCLADLAAPIGVLDLSDVDVFIPAFLSGCAP